MLGVLLFININFCQIIKFVFVKDGQVPEACFEIDNKDKDKIKKWYQKYKNKRNGTYMPLSRCLWQQQLQPWIRF